MRGKQARGSGRDRPRILFVRPFESTFIQTDEELLRLFCDVESLTFRGRSLYPRLAAGVAASDVVVCWFALGFAAVAVLEGRLLGKPTVVMSGGWDVSGMAEIGYGSLLSEWGVLRARIALANASRVLAFSEWSMQEVQKVAPSSRVEPAYLGVDPNRFRPGEKHDLVVTVGIVSRENLLRKGLKTFAEASRLVPQVPFVLVGRHTDDAESLLRRSAGANLSLPGWLPDDAFRELLGRARVYVQPSYTEGFGVAVAEAMASGCVPVVTSRGALPEVVGDAGLYFDYGDSTKLADAVQQAMSSNLGGRARRRVEENFTLDHRLRTLRRTIAEVRR